MPWNEDQAGLLRQLGVRWVRGVPAPTAAAAAEPNRPPALPREPLLAQQAAAASAPPIKAPAIPPVVRNAAPMPDRPQVANANWDELQQAVSNCQACGLCSSRTQTVFGVGSTQSHWMVVGEAPGEQEDLQGQPFVGASGRLLDQMLKALKLTRELPAPGAALEPSRQVYIANALKCRPPGNRNPQPEELQQCEAYLLRQLDLLRPRVILAMGRFAVQSLLRSTEPIGKLRGRVHQYQGVPLVVTYHPAYLLRNPLDKAKAWADLCLAADTFERAANNGLA